MTAHRSLSVRRGAAVLATVLCGCRPIEERVESADIPPPPSIPCDLDATSANLGVTAYKWPDGSTCQILLGGDRDTLTPLVPLIAGALEGFAGRRHLSIVMPNLRSLAGVEQLPPLDVLEIRDTPLVELSPLTQGDRAGPAFSRLTALVVSDSHITDVAGLRSVTTLEHLNLANNPRLRDVRALRALTRLQWLSLGATSVDDLTPLASLPSLTKFNLSAWSRDPRRRLSLQPLASLHRLEYLDIGGWECTDLASLRVMGKLTSLAISVGDELGPIPDLPGLVNLRLASDTLSSVDPLRRARRLENLSLKLVVPVPLTVLAELPKLRALNLLTGAWADEALAAVYARRPELRQGPSVPTSRAARLERSPMDDVRHVFLAGEEDSIEPLVPFVAESFNGFVGEKSLWISMPNLRSLDGIEGVPPLHELKIYLTPLVDVDVLTRDERPVPAVAALERLEVTNARLANISGLRTLSGLERLSLGDNRDLRDLSALHRMTRLRSLDLMHTDLPDLTALAGLTSLTDLSVSWKRYDYSALLSLHPLTRLRRLTHLLIGGRVCTDLAALQGLRALVDLSITIGVDLSVIPDLPQLRDLVLRSQELTSVAPLGRASRLETLWLDVEQPVSLTPLVKIKTLRKLHVSSAKSHDFIAAERSKVSEMRPDLAHEE